MTTVHEVLVAQIIRNLYSLAAPGNDIHIFPLTTGSSFSHLAGLSPARCPQGPSSSSPIVLWPPPIEPAVMRLRHRASSGRARASRSQAQVQFIALSHGTEKN